MTSDGVQQTPEASLQSDGLAKREGKEHLFRPGDPRSVESGRLGGQRSAEVRRMGMATRRVAEDGFGYAVGIMRDEIERLWDKRGGVVGRGKTQLASREEARLWFLADRLAAHTKHVLPLSVQAEVLHRQDIPIIPPDLLAQLRAMAPTPDAIAALEAGEEDDASPDEGQE